MSQLPKSWCVVAIPELLASLPDGKLLHQGWSPRCENHPSYSQDEWGALKTTAIQDGWFDPSFNKRLPDSLEPKPHLEVHSGDILLTCAGPRIRCGVACLVEQTRPKLMISGKMYRFRPDEKIVHPKYLLGYLRCTKAQYQIDQMKTGGSESGLNLTQARFSKLMVNLAPIEEQKRIVDKLNTLTARTCRAREELDRIPRLIERYKKAVLKSEFESCSDSVTLAEIIDEGPHNGWSPRSGVDAKGALTLKLTATTSGYLRLDNEATKRIYEMPSEDSKFWLKEGDILVQRANALEYLGATVIFSGSDKKYIYPDLMMRIRIKDEILREYIWHYLNYSETRKYFQERATGTAGNMPKINGKILNDLPVPIPRGNDFRSVLDRIKDRLHWIEGVFQDVNKTSNLLYRLDRSLLNKAFEGKLVTQSSNDEPASVLLERVRALRTEQNNGKKGKNRHRKGR